MASKILIVGGGAVGQVYGWALDQPGIEVSFYLKPKHAEKARQGYTLYWLNRDKRKKRPLELKNFRILTRPEEVASEAWDQIYLALSSTAIRSGWLKDFAPATLKARIIVMLQPGIEDRDYLLQYFPESKLVSGTISVIAYTTPLPESREHTPQPGTAFYFAPFNFSMMSGPRNLVKEATKQLTAGGLTTKYVDVPASQKIAFPNGLLTAFISALESVNWSLNQLKKPSQLQLLNNAIQEMLNIVSDKFQISPPFALKFISPYTLKFFLDAAPQLLPFEFEPYLKSHFTKVKDQTRLMMKDYISHGEKKHLPVNTLKQFEALNE